MVPIESPERLAELLGPLERRGLVERVPSGHGYRVERVAQRLCPALHPLDTPAAVSVREAPVDDPHAPTRAALAARVDGLETAFARLERQLRGLATKLGEPLDE